MQSASAPETVRVMIVDDHEIVRRGIAEIIERADGLEVVAEGDAAEFYVDGVLVNRVTDLSRTSGRLQIQSEGAEVFYRNITVTQ